MTRAQKIKVRDYLLDYYAGREGKSVRCAADGAVTIHVDQMPNTNQAGRIFAGWFDELLREAE